MRFEPVHVRSLGWQELTNGKLLGAAESSGFHVVVTVDKNMRHQQNLSQFSINLVTLDSPSIRLVDLIRLVPLAEDVIAGFESSQQTGANISVRI